MPNTLAHRAEDLITEKIRQDSAAAGPLGAETRRWERAAALRVTALPDLTFYNKARGMNEDDLPHLDAICEFYTSAGILPTLEVWASDATDRLGRTLATHGLFAGTVTATLHADLNDRPIAAPVTDHVTVTELDPADDDTTYFTTLLGGYGLSGAMPDRIAMMRAEHHPATVRRYLAHVDGRPAAAASLYIGKSGALLSGAATLPSFRRHGCQSALITRRLADAARFTDLAVVTVAFGSPSHANLERVGFNQTHTRTAWRPLRQK